MSKTYGEFPGINGTTFKIHFNEGFPYARNNILSCSPGGQFIVTKVYKINWWRKILIRLGFRVKLFKCVRYEEITT